MGFWKTLYFEALAPGSAVLTGVHLGLIRGNNGSGGSE